MFYVTLLAILASSGLVLFLRLRKKSHFWKDKGILYKPISILEIYKVLFNRDKSFYEYIIEDYQKYNKEEYIGQFQFFTPCLQINDLSLIKKVTIKDFDHFSDHIISKDDLSSEILLSSNLVALKGQQWREMRNLLSPAFTGLKMRSIFVLANECALKFTQYFQQHKELHREVELKDAFTKYTNDVIASTAFGFTCDSLNNPENEFFVTGKEMLNFRTATLVKGLVFNASPRLAKLLRLRLIGKNVEEFFRRIVRETCEYRERNNVSRPDMVQLLLDARKDGKDISDLEIIAQGFIFFLAGFETASFAMTFMALELALNPQCQRKLCKEIDDVLAADGNLTYDLLMNMKYLDMVVSETLRKWPAAPASDRLCTKDYKIDGALELEKDVAVIFPVLGIHRDEKYYPDPDRFDPERFNDENRQHLNPDAFLPFGIGPRACIGSRFALMEIKVLFVELLSKFELVAVEKTTSKLDVKSFKTQPASGGFYVALKPRNNSFSA